MNVLIIAAFVKYNREHAAEWVDGEGACCPACLHYRGVRVRVTPYASPELVRYFRCPQCMTTFKSVKHDAGAASSKLPESADKPKKKRQAGVKKRRD
jgi:hypothetical protein